MLEWEDLRMTQDKNPNAVMAEASLHAARTPGPYNKKSRMRMGWKILIELLNALNSEQLPKAAKKAIPLAELPPTASHMIQRNPDFGENKSYWISTRCHDEHLQVQPISRAIMEEKAPLRTMERASLDSCNVRISFSENGTLDEHGRERQHSEKARCDAQSCKTEKTMQQIIGETREQSSDNNDDESEHARRRYRKAMSIKMTE